MYKQIIKKRATRLKLLKMLDFVPDSVMVPIQYRIKTGCWPNLKNPQRFTEKLQWYKLHYRDPLMAQCVDKYEVRSYVKSCGLGSILNECYGVYDRVSDIDFASLPQRFVLKDTLGGGGNSVILCKDKARLDVGETKKRLQEWLDIGIQKVSPGREWVYCQNKHRILIEKYLDSDPEQGGLIDYKFLCFSGRAELLYIIADRKLGEASPFGIYTREFSQLSVQKITEKPFVREIQKPKCYDDLLNIAETLAVTFPEVRVDLYARGEEVVFGEMTFFDDSGYIRFEPDDFDFVLGERFKLPSALK